MKQLTPVIVVDAIEPVLGFWMDRLGFEMPVNVPEDDHLGFVILQKGSVEVMYQTRRSVAEDMPALLEGLDGIGSAFFIEVEDLDAVEAALEGLELAVPRRTTFYGMAEIGVHEPAGHLVVFAQQTGEQA